MSGRDFSNPGTKFVEVNEMLEHKQRNSSPMSSLTASWSSPIDSLDPSLVPEDKRRMILETRAKELEKPAETPTREQPASQNRIIDLPMSRSSQGSVLIPAQAVKMFKKVLDKLPPIEVLLTPEQAESLLGELQLMKTPRNMADAKAIIKLSDQLERIVEEATHE